MKVDIIRKFKWYIVGFILVAIMLSVSLSFCSWDTLSVKASMNANSGGFKLMYNLVDDKDKNSVVSVGDIVTYGSYYQEVNQTTKTPIRWIVVDKIDGVLTLAAEQVLASGSFSGTYYFDDDGMTIYGENALTYNQNYTISTVRVWLNSEGSRVDGGTSISKDSKEPRVVFKGFASQAFTAKELDNIIPKTISGMAGYTLDNKKDVLQYPTITDKVWLASASEVFGSSSLIWQDGKSDGQPNTQFEYFKDSNNVKVTATAFALSSYSNYTMAAALHSSNVKGLRGDSAYWLRSPANPKAYATSVISVANINVQFQNSDHSFVGVRPFINISLYK